MSDSVHQTVRNRRVDYAKGELTEDNAALDPFDEFEVWLDAAQNDGAVSEPNAMTVATVDATGQPTARVVLMRGFDLRGLEFYTNYESAKGRDLNIDPRISAVFFWPSMQRQIRVNGIAKRIDASESDAYFEGRPYKSKLGAHVSKQSAPIASRKVLEDDMEALKETYSESDDIPRPQNWGGFRIEPMSFEFWQGRRSRLHDRLLYERFEEKWTRVRLAP